MGASTRYSRFPVECAEAGIAQRKAEQQRQQEQEKAARMDAWWAKEKHEAEAIEEGIAAAKAADRRKAWRDLEEGDHDTQGP